MKNHKGNIKKLIELSETLEDGEIVFVVPDYLVEDAKKQYPGVRVILHSTTYLPIETNE